MPKNGVHNKGTYAVGRIHPNAKTNVHKVGCTCQFDEMVNGMHKKCDFGPYHLPHIASAHN